LSTASVMRDFCCRMETPPVFAALNAAGFGAPRAHPRSSFRRFSLLLQNFGGYCFKSRRIYLQLSCNCG
jgi:hypothetical protein